MPTAGSNTNPATSDPIAAPMVLTSVRTPAVSMSEASPFLSAAPTSGKKVPDTNDTGSISGRLTRRMASGCVIDAKPNGAMTDGNAAYDATVATAPANATGAAKRCASGTTRIQSDAAATAPATARSVCQR